MAAFWGRGNVVRGIYVVAGCVWTGFNDSKAVILDRVRGKIVGGITFMKFSVNVLERSGTQG